MSKSPYPAPRLNHLLAALPARDLERFAEYLEPVQLPLGTMLYQPGEKLRHAWFPTSAIVSLHYVTATGAAVETAGVGHEGVVGTTLFMGGETTTSAAVVETAGHALRLNGMLLKQEFSRGGSLCYMLLRYTQALMAQISLAAACNRHHSVEQRLSRWLLGILDRKVSNEIAVTQELVAHMLGVRREGITVAAGNLQRAGYISSRRGHIAVLQRAGLEASACGCYAVVKKEIQRLLADMQKPEGHRGRRDGFTPRTTFTHPWRKRPCLSTQRRQHEQTNYRGADDDAGPVDGQPAGACPGGR